MLHFLTGNTLNHFANNMFGNDENKMLILCLSWSSTNTVAARQDVLAPIIRRLAIIDDPKSQLHSLLALTVSPISRSFSKSVPFIAFNDNQFQKMYLNIIFPPLVIPHGALASTHTHTQTHAHHKPAALTINTPI